MSDRLYSKSRDEVEGDSEQSKAMELAQMLKTDIKNEIIERPPTRMERKFKRIFGSAGASSQTFLMGFKMGALVGGGFGGVMGTYQAI